MSIATGDRLHDLGFDGYTANVASPACRRVRERYVASGWPAMCAVCGHDHTQPHHRMHNGVGGAERPAELVALCGGCHRALHRLRRAEPWRTTTSAAQELRRRLRANRTVDRTWMPDRRGRHAHAAHARSHASLSCAPDPRRSVSCSRIGRGSDPEPEGRLRSRRTATHGRGACGSGPSLSERVTAALVLRARRRYGGERPDKVAPRRWNVRGRGPTGATL